MTEPIRRLPMDGFGRVRCVVLAWFVLTVFSQGVWGAVIAAPSPCEVRGVWLNPPAFSSPERRQDTLRKIDEAHLNTLFLLTPPVQTHRGWSTPEAFSAMLQEAVSHGLSVHGWIPNAYRIPDGADLTLPQEQAQQVQWAMALLEAYPALDGIHFDYIRFRKGENVNRHKMESISEVVRLAFRAIHQRYPRKFLSAAVLSAAPSRANDRTEDVPEWFIAWTKAHPGNRYAFPVLGGSHSVPTGFKYQQDAIGWLREGLIDGIMPMEYTTDDGRWQENVKSWVSFQRGNPNGIYPGLGWLTEKGNPDWGYDARGVVRKIKYGRHLGLRGFVVFELSAFRDIDPVLVNALSIDSAANDFDAPFRTVVQTCLSSQGTRDQGSDGLR